MGIKKPDILSIRDYLNYEYPSELKHEYEKGTMLAMSGGTLNHGILCGNAYNELREQVKRNHLACSTIGSEVRIHIKEADSIVYPDAMVICGGIEVSEDDEQAITNPMLVVEVLSKSTGEYDRGDKFYKYRLLGSFKEYILVEQDKAVVETFYKRENNIWEISRITGLDQSVEIKSLGIQIRLRELYENVRWK